MKKRLLAFVCMVVVALGIFAVAATNAKATGDDVTYKVGYVKVDITPWQNSTGTTLIPVNTAGYGASSGFYAGKLIDGNGDGQKNRDDGIYATCTVLTEFVGGTEGKTLVFISMDACNGYSSFTNTMREQIVPAVVAQNANADISDDHIFVSGSHCHTAPNFNTLSTSTDSAEKAYYEKVVADIKNAVVQAYSNKAEASISRGTIDAAQYYGCQMNYIRHYYVDRSGSNYDGYWGSGFGTNVRNDYYSRQFADADGTMELVKFTFTDGTKNPVLLVNWRAHPDNVGASDNYLSADYVGALRYRLENNKTKFSGNCDYNVSFIQGASGNINAFSALSDNSVNKWYNKTPNASFTNTTGTGEAAVPFVKYGYLLAEAAISDDVSWQTVSGQIRNLRTKYQNAKKSYTAAEVTAAEYAKNNNKSLPYKHTNGVVIESGAHRDNILLYRTNSETHTVELNTILIGDGLSFVTAPGELFDRYDSNGSATTDSAESGWSSLSSIGYGEPIVMGYTNGDMGYIPNKAAYNYNANANPTYLKVGKGSYEALTSAFAEGIGEKLISDYKNMLSWTAGMTTTCAKCNKPVTFEPIAQGSVGNVWYEGLPSGHYYLAENINLTKGALYLYSNTETCLHLNGYKLENAGAQGAITVGKDGDYVGSVLNIMDHENNAGVIQSKNQTLIVRGTVNQYGGSIKCTTAEAVASGEAIYIAGGTVNQHGGAIYGGKTTGNGGAIRFWNGSFNLYDGYVYGGSAVKGGAIALAGACSVNVYGGEITAGTVSGVGDCIWITDNYTSRVSISGEPIIDSIYIPIYKQENLYLAGNFSGTIKDGITFGNLAMAKGIQLGTALDGVAVEKSVKVKGTETAGVFYLNTSGTKLVATDIDPSTTAAWIGGTAYGDIGTAIQNFNEAQNKPIRLNRDIDVAVDKTIYLDLNGHDANVVVNSGTVYVMDSATDDYKGGCGIITGTGDIQAVPENSTVMGAKEGFYSAYLKKDEGNNTYSFHRVDVGIVASHTSPKKQGIRYECGFYGDEFVAGQVKQYGVAVSIKGDPVSGNALTDDAKTTTFTPDNGFGGNSSYITGILKESNGFAVNKRNAAMPIYGRAYVLLNDDSYWFGDMTETSLQSAYQEINEMWGPNTLQALKDQTFDLYAKFRSVMKSWNIDKIVADAEATAKAEEEGTVKILTVGSSHSMDAMWLLYEVYQQRREADPSLPKLELGILYYSGCHIDQHVEFALNDLPAYEYFKINAEIYNKSNSEADMYKGWQKNGEAFTVSELEKKDPSWASNPEYVHIKTAKTATSGTYVTKNGWTLLDGLKDEQWDMVVLQDSANYIAHGNIYFNKDTFGLGKTDLNWLKDYIKTNAKVVPEFSFHAQWASPMNDDLLTTNGDANSRINFEKWFGSVSDTGNGKFTNEDGDLSDENRLAMQRKMTQMMLTNAETYISGNKNFAHKIISGAAISYAVEHYKGTNETTNENLAEVNAVFYRDYTHLSDYGRLIVANLWFEELFGNGNLTEEEAVTEVPSKFYTTQIGVNMTDDLKTLLRNAVNYALNPETAYVNPWTTE